MEILCFFGLGASGLEFRVWGLGFVCFCFKGFVVVGSVKIFLVETCCLKPWIPRFPKLIEMGLSLTANQGRPGIRSAMSSA